MNAAAASPAHREEWNSISPASGSHSAVYYSSVHSRTSSDGHSDRPPRRYSPSHRYLSPSACFPSVIKKSLLMSRIERSEENQK